MEEEGVESAQVEGNLIEAFVNVEEINNKSNWYLLSSHYKSNL